MATKLPTPDLQRLASAYAVIDGIPEGQVTLRMWNDRGGKEPTAETISSVSTWLARHPAFQIPGFELTVSDYDEWCYVARSQDITKGRTESQCNVDFVATLFGLQFEDAWALFADREIGGRFDPDPGLVATLSDKAFWQLRVRAFLESRGYVFDVQPKDSSLDWRIAFCEANRTLTIEFQDGSRYRYLDVPRDAATALIEAPSPGTVFNKSIRGFFQHRRLD